MKFRRGDLLFHWHKNADDGAAATATDELLVGRLPTNMPCRMIEAHYTPDAALTADASNYASLLLDTAANGGTRTNRSTLTTEVTGTGDWVAFTAEAFSLGTWNGHLDAGDIITFEITKAGTGVVVPSGVLTIHLRPTRQLRV